MKLILFGWKLDLNKRLEVKMNRTYRLILLAVVIVTTTTTAVYAQYGGGSGTIVDPYIIETATHLNNVRNNLNAHFRQEANINLNVAPYNQGQGWEPIGNGDTPFTGHYNGNGHFIIHLMINRSALNNVGLFGFCQNATLENLAVIEANVIGSRWTGILVGDFSSTTVNDGNIINCFSSGTVRGLDRVGGLAGFVIRSSVINSGSTANATGTATAEIGCGGLVGFISTSGTIRNCFARGSVNPTQNGSHLGGLVGRANSATITNSYSTGAVSGQNSVGGLIGAQAGTNTTGSYWNTQTSEQQQSDGGTGRNTEQMTYPYDAQTYTGWDFDDIWAADEGGNINNGYPYLFNIPGLSSDLPNVAANPIPANDSTDVSVDIEELAWSYYESTIFANPVGFRVYLNTTGQFGADDDYVWVEYSEGEENYSTGEILPDEIFHGRMYYWKVVPTTTDPEERGDAENVPVWRFTTELSDNPKHATNPIPANDSTDVSVDLASVGWMYISDPGYADPAGFRVYMNTSGEFGEEDDFEWVNYQTGITIYGNSAILPDELQYNTTYFWMVVPTTTNPNDNRGYRGDAENVPVWSFTTLEYEPYPVPAVNPHPSHMSTGVSLGLTAVSWDYYSSENHVDPVGFRVYLNTTGNFGGNAPFEWVPYHEGEAHYSATEIVTTPLDWETTYYWRVVPTTSQEDGNDAQGVITWRFTSGTTDIEDLIETPLITELNGNYPNPFNPETTINFSIADQSIVTLDIYNIRGAKIINLLDKNMEQGKHKVLWNGRDSSGSEVGSGVYFYRLNAKSSTGGTYTETKKMILMK